jgi:hypothetical protein
MKGSPPELLFKNPNHTSSGYPAWTVAQETISNDPVIGPPYCMRDTDGDYQPDKVTNTFSTKDDIAYIEFPYDNMQDGMIFSHEWEVPGGSSVLIVGASSWDGGETGFHVSYFGLQHAPGVIKIKLYLENKLMQEIECEVVEPN